MKCPEINSGSAMHCSWRSISPDLCVSNGKVGGDTSCFAALQARAPKQLPQGGQTDEGDRSDMLSHGITWAMAEAILAAAEQAAAACLPAKRKKYAAEVITGACCRREPEHTEC